MVNFQYSGFVPLNFFFQQKGRPAPMDLVSQVETTYVWEEYSQGASRPVVQGDSFLL